MPMFYPEFCGTRPDFSTLSTRVVGGIDAKEGQIPWQVGDFYLHSNYFTL